MFRFKLFFSALCCLGLGQVWAGPPPDYNQWTVNEIPGPTAAPAAPQGELVRLPVKDETRYSTFVTDGNPPTSTPSPGGCTAYPSSGTGFGFSTYSRGPFVFIPNVTADAVMSFNVNVHPIVAQEVASGDTPYGVVISQDGRYAYVSNRGGASVSVIDALKSTVIKTLAVGANPAGLALNSDGTELYVANEADNTLSVIDTKSGAGIATLPLEISPHAVLFMQDKIYALDRRHGALAIIGAERQTEAVIQLADASYTQAQDMAFDHAGQTLYITLQDPLALRTALLRLDVTQRKPESTLTLDGLPKGLQLSRYDENHIYVLVDTPLSVCASLHVVDTADFTVPYHVKVDHGVEGMTWGIGGFYIVNQVTNELVRLDVNPKGFKVFSFNKPIALRPGAGVLGSFMGEPVALDIIVNPVAIDFGGVAVGHSTRAMFTITNNDAEPFTITSLAIKEPSFAGRAGNEPGNSIPMDFSVVEDLCLNTRLSPGEVCSVELAYAPDQAGLHAAQIDYWTDLELGHRLNARALSLRGEGIQAVAAPTALEGSSANAEAESPPRTGGGVMSWMEVLLLFIGAGALNIRRESGLAH